ncbi:glycoside hydrolase family 3 protein [Serratia sp. UGAL515B_01]|uniref:glycoside hydrolase family 3 protein n=1 Tax=Serratia sp. UGAL515B_01 TaxID=2986763 RepID=UPI00295381F5|nr:glycoside hydrolase family 3 N-terminal domain-containing protein [Serratia sp. UGAL515B_01]WON77354.1 glycoside hydrolase family 3 protein [Serratia sp. UGAL515B_01]
MGRRGIAAIAVVMAVLAFNSALAQLSISQQEPLWSAPRENAVQMVSQMTTREKIGQVLMLDVRNWGKNAAGEPKNVTVLPAELAKVITDYRLGSVILFRENFINTPQSYQLIQDLQKASYPLPLLISTDQEGGYVTRLREGTEMPGNMALAATRNESMAQRVGEVHGSELNALGVHINFAPVMDVNTNQNNPVIGVRSFGSNIALVDSMSVAYINGLHKNSVLATAKHFPGHGNVATDSHFGLPQVSYSESEWRQTDLLPFKNAIDNGLDAVLTAHIIVPALDDTKVISKKDGTEIGLPATLSKKIISGILRDELKFNGLVFTDALDMGAIVDNFGVSEATEMALLAGSDVLVMPIHIWDNQGIAQLEELYRYLETESQKKPELAARLQQAATQVVQTKLANRLTPYNPHTLDFAQSVVASSEHKRYEKEVAENAITLIKNDGLLPYQLKAKNNFLVISDENARNKLVSNELQSIASELNGKQIAATILAFKLDEDSLPNDLAKRMQASDLVILVTYNLKAKSTAAQKVIDQAEKLNKPVVVISSRNPYDIAYLDNVKANIAIYGITGFDVTNNNRNSLEANIKAGIRTLFKNNDNNFVFNTPKGKLPVDIRNSQGDIIYSFGHGLTY